MARFGFCGPTYQAQSVNADAQRCVNLYLEANESGQGKSAAQLYGTPGLKRFCTLPTGTLPQVRGLLSFNGRCFAASDTKFCEIMADGTITVRGSITTDGFPVSMDANGANQILLASAGILYIYDLVANTLSAVTGAPTNISLVDYADGFFVALTRDSNMFQLSGLLDGTSWSGLDVAKVSVFADHLVSMTVEHRELALLGQKRSAVYYDSGNTFAFDVIPSGFLEQGCAATFAVSRMDNSVFWIGADERGAGIAWRNNGYSPVRISNHSVEQIWAKYPTIADAISYAFQMGGHTFWHIFFPSGTNDLGLPFGASWRYDAATQVWHEVTGWDSPTARLTAHRSQCHAFAFGIHLVGDWKTGSIYWMDERFLDDDGAPIRRVRRAPHISTEQQRIFGAYFQLDLETGLGPQPPLLGADLGVAKAPSTIILKDANGVLWQITIDDSGNFQRVVVASGTPQTIILSDSGMTPTSAWQLGITIAGNLTTTDVTPAGGGGGYGDGGYGDGGYGDAGTGAGVTIYPQIYVMESTPGNHLTGILVTVSGGLGLLQTNTPNQARDPQVCLRVSKDGGHTWSNERWRGAGKAGEYKKRVIWRRLGAWRDLVIEISMSDPVPWRIVDAYIDASPGFQPTERLTSQLRKGA